MVDKGNGETAQINWRLQKIMKIGRAYRLRLKQRESHKEELKASGAGLTCRLLDGDAEGERSQPDQLLVHPDGKVQICCQQEAGTDFGFGNLKKERYDDIAERIETHPLLNSGFDDRLAEMQVFIEAAHSELVPNDGFSSGCDICNLFYRNRGLREEIEEMLGLKSGLEKIVSS